jgi:Amt family ammonium transporter
MKLKTLIPAFGAFMIASSAQAQETAVAVPTDTVFILNSLLFLIGGFFSILDGSRIFNVRSWPCSL